MDKAQKRIKKEKLVGSCKSTKVRNKRYTSKKKLYYI